MSSFEPVIKTVTEIDGVEWWGEEHEPPMPGLLPAARKQPEIGNRKSTIDNRKNPEPDVRTKAPANSPRLSGPLSLPPHVEAMMKRIHDDTGCGVLVLPRPETALFRRLADEQGLSMHETFSRLIQSVLLAIASGDASVRIDLTPGNRES